MISFKKRKKHSLRSQNFNKHLKLGVSILKRRLRASPLNQGRLVTFGLLNFLKFQRVLVLGTITVCGDTMTFFVFQIEILKC